MKPSTLSILMIAGILLTACSSSPTGASIVAMNTSLPLETQIAVGTLKLAGTDQEITVEQARDLLVYWEVYKDLGQSQTAAQAEVDGLVAQIQETMTSNQLKAIADMNLTQQDVNASMQGVTAGSNNASDSKVSIPSSSPSSGGMPSGGPPPDAAGGMPADVGGAAPASGGNQAQSKQTSSNSSVAANVPSALVEAVIQALQQKIAA